METPQSAQINNVEYFAPVEVAAHGGAASNPAPPPLPLQETSRGKRASGGKSGRLMIKGPWSLEEDRKLVELVNLHGEGKWAEISESMIGRAGKQCRERWRNNLRPGIKRDPWTETEELVLVEAHRRILNKWATIAMCIPGRTENGIKNHWNTTKKRLKKQMKKPSQHHRRPTILESYMKAVILRDAATTAAPAPTIPAGRPTVFGDGSNQVGLAQLNFSDSSSNGRSFQVMKQTYFGAAPTNSASVNYFAGQASSSWNEYGNLMGTVFPSLCPWAGN
ncbi:transcription factor MYB119-like [Diospyros lotus]|uniref:transcription factor MYB119-like n=1 Tax=Diospyros lotus TaxID=55363 RepID=UPI0022590969|nr:transcription factor MYB119-like [Diospyros lotus]